MHAPKGLHDEQARYLGRDIAALYTHIGNIQCALSLREPRLVSRYARQLARASEALATTAECAARNNLMEPLFP